MTTACEYDGSFSGARLETDRSNGYIKKDGRFERVVVDATLAFPIIVAETFAKQVHGGE